MELNSSTLFIQFMNSIALAMNLFIIAVGLSLIFGVLRVINFAHGAFFMLGAYILFSVVDYFGETGLSFWMGVSAAVVGLGVISFAVERLLLRHLYDKEHLLQLLFTFALVLIVGDVTKFIWGAEQHSVSSPPGLKGSVNLGLSHYPSYLLFLIVLGLILAIVIWMTLDRTRWGRIARAARLDREMLGSLGVNVKAVYSMVFVVGAMLAGLGGALAAPRMALDPGMDALIIIDCFVIVIVGGLGSLWGSLLGALILGASTIFGALFLQEWQLALSYLLLIVVLLWRPSGLLGKLNEDRH